MSVALIISTYNRPDALHACLRSVKAQSRQPDEILIADDGSGQETENVIREFQAGSKCSVQHIWHEDKGFRLAAIRNRAIAATDSDYIIQIDGDLLLHKNFIGDHLSILKPGFFVAGSRVMLNEQETERALENEGDNFKPGISSQLDFNALRSRFLKRIFAAHYKTKGRHIYYVKGCNMAFFRTDLLKVNGYNEGFSGWGSEDREIAIRLINAGVKKQAAKMIAICYHLYHTVTSREMALKNRELMINAIENKLTWAEDGLKKYLAVNPEKG